MQPDLTIAGEPLIGRARASAQAVRLAAPIELEHDPEKWIPVFGKRSCSNKKLERDDDSKKSHHALTVPAYLISHYWWAYVHPHAVRVFERQWLVNLILWGNYPRLSESALDELGDELPGATLQVACVYGDLTERLCARAGAGGGRVDIVDVLPIQLANLRAKLPPDAPARLLPMNSADLKMPAGAYDRALVFFLLHEQPRRVRECTLAEVARVVKPGGKIVVVDYARPRWWNPLRYLWRPVLALLEPFALDLWRDEIGMWLPSRSMAVRRRSFFGGLYQQLVVVNGE